jgi:hypothetical protein
MNKSYNEYAKKFETQLRSASKTDTKKFWKILKSFSKNKNSEENKISLDRLYEYFKELNSSENEASSDDFSRIYSQNDVDLLNSEITEDEVIKAAENLKNSKAPGLDDIVNEYLKTTVTKFLPFYVKLFDLIFDSGESPDSWTLGIFKAIYKNKGDPNDPDNYRAISLVSSVGKLFTSILNSRLSNFSDETDLVTKSQAGFRAGYLTQDNIVILYSVITLYLSKKKKLFCCFIDFKKEFDTIWRAGLWQKLINSNIHGKIFKIIFSFYDNFKSCVKSGHTFSDFFHLRYWCKTGRKFIPFLFAIYLNDLEEFLTEHCKTGLDTLNSLSVKNLNVYMKLFLLLYADDTVIFAESQQELQQILKLFEHYCNIWKLKVNISKTKIVVFSKKKSNQNFSYEMFGEKISQQDDYNYLGLLFNYNGNFYKARKKLLIKPKKHFIHYISKYVILIFQLIYN